MLLCFCVLSILYQQLIFPFLSRKEISCRIVYDDPKLGVCAISRPRGRPLTTEILKSDEAIMSEISDLQKELTFCNDKKLVLMISFASEEMIRETMKYPEVFYGLHCPR